MLPLVLACPANSPCGAILAALICFRALCWVFAAGWAAGVDGNLLVAAAGPNPTILLNCFVHVLLLVRRHACNVLSGTLFWTKSSSFRIRIRISSFWTRISSFWTRISSFWTRKRLWRCYVAKHAAIRSRRERQQDANAIWG